MDKITLRKVQLAQLEIAKEIKRVCEENDIKYWLDSGSLLGAVRHQGFIPWDDDLDIGMLREDYEKFCKIAPEKLGKEYFLQTWESDPGYNFFFAKVRKLGTRYVEAIWSNANAHMELYVDIFPYDVFPEKKSLQRKQGTKIMFLKYAMKLKGKVRPWVRHKGVIKKVLVFIKYIPFGIGALFLPRNYAMAECERTQKKYNGTISKYVNVNGGASSYGVWVMPCECFARTQELPFEDTTFSCPIKSDEYLKRAYGDYMQFPPEKDRENRHEIIEIKL